MAQFHLPTIEEEQLKSWDEKEIFRKVLAKKGEKGKFVFFEGPPTANGKPGIHHMLTRAFKDVILRFKTMQGYHIDRKAGWDTQGLPVELGVEKQLGFTKKQDIEAYGIAAFNKKCKESVWEYKELWQKMTKRTAFWVDMENPYITYENDFIESCWSILKKIDEKGLLYQGYRITPHCPRCNTSLSSHELAQGYKDVEDPSVFVKFEVTGEEKTFFLVWTTTPWTLPSNVALAVGADVDYVKIAFKENGEQFILAKALLSKVDGEFEVKEELKGSALVGKSYAPLYQALGDATADKKSNAHKVYAGDFVSTVDGTGIVHIAPAYGEDDAKLGTAANLPTVFTVDATGMVVMAVPGQGQFFKKSDEAVKADLTERGLLYKAEKYLHSYPFCWRCSTPLLYLAKSSWYIKMSALRDKLLQNNAKINWVPEHIKDGRFGEWLKDVKDWALSRERYWGTPLPVWKCEACKHQTVAGSLAEIEKYARPRNKYFLQRHGEADSNVRNILSSWPEQLEVHLTEKGREQVAASAKKLKEKNIDLIFSSDLLRTKETSAIIAAELGLEVQFEPRLREIDTGIFNGKNEADYHKFFAYTLERFDKKVEGGESLNDVRARMVEYVKELEAKHAGKNILFVSHGDPLWLVETGFAGVSNEDSLTASYNGVGEFHEMELKRLPHDEMGHLDVHRPYIDEVDLVCEKCQGMMKRVPDLVDVWFDSGAMPFAQWHYPFENKERIDNGTNFPADYISEAIDQTRGWFYTLLAVSTLLGYDEPPYKNVICLGHINDSKGQKMSKSKGNIVDPWEMMNKYGADAIRYHFFTMNQPGETKRFDEKSLEEVTKKVFLILWNVLSFWKMFAQPDQFAHGDSPTRFARGQSPQHPLDKWLMSELAHLVAETTHHLEKYEVVEACRDLGSFVNELSTWYVRRSRDRFKNGSAEEKAQAAAMLGFALSTLAKLFAPFTPFLADALAKETASTGDSIHLENWPEISTEKGFVYDEGLSQQMKVVRNACSFGQEQRALVAIPVRQALGSATVRCPQELSDWMHEIVADELNVHEVRWEKDAEGFSVTLDTTLTPELKREGAARELVRNINDQRKGMKLTLADRIVVEYATTSEFWQKTVEERGEEVKNGTLCDELRSGVAGDDAKELEIDGEKIALRVVKR